MGPTEDFKPPKPSPDSHTIPVLHPFSSVFMSSGVPKAATGPSLSPTWGSPSSSGRRAHKAIPPPLPPAPHFPAIWFRSPPPRRGEGHPIPLLLPLNPRHHSPGHPVLEGLVVLYGSPGWGGNVVSWSNYSDRRPGASTLPRYEVDLVPQGASSAITGYQCV